MAEAAFGCLDFLNGIRKVTVLAMQGQGSSVFGGVAHGEQGGDGKIFGQVQDVSLL